MTNGKQRGNCRFAPCINCSDPTSVCSSCGWDPIVSQRRLEKIRKERQMVLRERAEGRR